MKQKLLSIAIVFGALMLMSAGTVKVHTCGDSTMAPYDEAATVTRGWGMYFQQFLNGVTSVNYARGGRDTRGFYEEADRWGAVKKNMQPGDYVLIQFAHNDEKNGGMDGYALKAYYESIGNTAEAAKVDTRGSVPTTTYKEYLRKYVEETRVLGGNPILVAPVCRSYFDGKKIRRNGRHDLGDSFSVLTANGPVSGQSVPESDHSMDYPYQMKLVAEEMNVPFIDLTTATAELYESYGDAKCHEYLFDGDGSTHFNTTGALLVARKCAELMKAQGILADNIVLPTDLTVTPSDGDMGQAYTGQVLTKEFTLNGFGLVPESGTVTITASEGIKISADKTTWVEKLSTDYNASTLVKTFYAQLTLEKAGVTEGTVTIASGDKTIVIPVKATAIVVEGGVPVKAYWRLEKDESCQLTGPATVLGQSWSNMYVQRYACPKGGTDANGNYYTQYPDGIPAGETPDRKTQRNLLKGDNWPDGEIDDNPERYIDFGLKANIGTELKITNISLYVGGAGGNGMMCHVYYSTDNYQTRTTIYAPSKMVSNTMNGVSNQPVITLKEGEEVHVRIYPWYDGAASGKTICLSDVTIEGMAFSSSSTGISNTMTGSEVVSVKYYDVAGRELQGKSNGMNIVRTVYADGTTTTHKTINN
jgi:lysophospholipase L1-like esterase